MCMNVDLPEPDGPTTATNSPRRMSMRDAAEGVHRRALHGVGLGEVVNGDQRRVRRVHSVLRGAAAADPFLPAKL